MKNRLPLLLIGLGILLAIVSLLADFIGLGDHGGIPAVQILGAEAGVGLALLGLGWGIHQRNGGRPGSGGWGEAVAWVLNQPILTWVLLGFLIAYLLCFVAPAIYNPDLQFRYFTDYIREREKIGFDTRLILEHVSHWYTGEQTPKYLFPPLTTILFTPLLLLRFPHTYYVSTVVTLVSFALLNLWLPWRFLPKGERSLMPLLFVVTAVSYGLQFELETGQFYTLAMLSSMAALYIFHRQPAWRIFAYMLFCVSVQLKIFPAIFVFLFVDNWRDWRVNLKRFAALGLANFLLLFLLGFSYFQLFVTRILGSLGNLEVRYNHSITVFVHNLAGTNAWAAENADWLKAALFGWFLLCFAAALFLGWKRNAGGLDATLLMVSLIGGLILPTISHDYNLPLLSLPFLLWTSGLRLPEKPWTRLLALLLLLLASFAFAVTLFPSNARPAALENSLPALMIILTAVTGLGFMQRQYEPESKVS
ncbi:MAG: glycosyltransferase family 87 protein [Chloroflexota bacterium]